MLGTDPGSGPVPIEPEALGQRYIHSEVLYHADYTMAVGGVDD